MEIPRPKSNSSTILVDTDAFIALVRLDDANHERAQRLFQALEKKSVTFCTSNYVFSEVLTVLSQRVGHSTAMEFARSIKSVHNPILVHWVNEEVENRALTIFEAQASKNVSFTDCTNMALLDRLTLEYIFSFDAVYRKNGYSTVERFVEIAQA